MNLDPFFGNVECGKRKNTEIIHVEGMCWLALTDRIRQLFAVPFVGIR